jgi:hypothetical protein
VQQRSGNRGDVHAVTRLALLLLVGCNQVLGIHATSSLHDADGDGIADLDDNCPLTPNPDQADEDNDGVGNACDSCPLIVNAGDAQTNDLDGDGLPDACDAHALDPRDCLILFDTFTDPKAFADHWRVLPMGRDPAVHVEPDQVTIAPGMSSVAIVATDLGGLPLNDLYDVEVFEHGGVMAIGASVTAASNVTDDLAGYRCELEHLSSGDYATAAYIAPAPPSPNLIVGDHVNNQALLRLVTKGNGGNPRLACRVEFGGALGASESQNTVMQLTDGAPGVIVTGDDARIAAIAIYRFDPTATECPPPIYR